MYSLILHGKRCIELQNWRNLRVISVKLVQNVSVFSNSFSSSSHTDASLQNGLKGKIFTVESFGSTTKLAESISKKENSESVLNLLRNFGFTDSQISRIISTYPRLLIVDAEKSLLPKLQALQSRGASNSEVTEIISEVPKILAKRGVKSIGVYYDFVKDIIHNDKDEQEGDKSLLDSSPAGKQGNKIRNISVLRDLGVPQRFLLKLLISKYQPVCGKEKFEESVKRIVDMGFDPTTPKFVQALHVVYEMSEKTIDEKVNVYKNLGFAVEDVWEMFKKWPYALKFSEKKIAHTFETLKNRCGLVDEEVISVIKKRPECMRASDEKITNCVETFLRLGFSRDEFALMVKCFPTCIGLSDETVKKKVEFLVKKMNWTLKDVVLIPPVLGYSLEKRILPRCDVIKALVSKGLIKGGRNGVMPLPMSSVLVNSNQVFVKRYVMKHDNEKLVSELMSIFTGDRDRAPLIKGHTMKQCNLDFVVRIN